MSSLLFLLVLAAGPAFSESSYDVLKRLAKFGHRHAGAPRRAEAIALLTDSLKKSGLSVETRSFSSPDPRTGKPWAMTNVVGRVRPEAACRFLLGSHFDTRHVAEEDPDPARRVRPIQGANDGTSGVAVLLALAPRLAKLLPPGVGADVVLFDGEEMGYPDVGAYCAGSNRYAADLPLKGRPKFGIILDMVCAPESVYKVEGNSMKAHPALVEALWSLGAAREPAAFDRARTIWIGDDHVPLSRAGVPSVLLIGYDYAHWHKSSDTVPRCSPKRLALIEGVLEDFIRTKLPQFLEGCR